MHVRNALVGFSNTLQPMPYLATLGNEIVIRIDDKKCCNLFVKLQIFHVLSSYAFT